MDFEEDTHLCLRCSKTIVGLDNYIEHRQQNCLSFQPSLTSTQETISSVLSITEDLAISTCEPPSVATSTMQTQNTPYIVHLTADDFFSSLELQSKASTIKNTVSADVTPSETQKNLILPKDGESTATNFIRSAIEQAPALLETDEYFGQDIIISFGDCDNDLYPPTSHTGGKWKPGSRPDLTHKHQWEVLSSPCSPTDEKENCDKDNAENDHNGNKKTCDAETTIDTPEIFKGHFECAVCSRKLSDKYTYARHLKTSYHRKNSFKIAEENSFECDSNVTNVEESNILHKEKDFQHLSLLQSSQVPVNNSATMNTNSFICEICDLNLKSELNLAVHYLSSEHKIKMSNKQDWYKNVFKYEIILTKSSVFQCHICLYYFNDFRYFVLHMKEKLHVHNAAQLRQPQVCIPCHFECRSSDDMSEHLISKLHHITVLNLTSQHPVMVSEKLQPITCHFCEDKSNCSFTSRNNFRHRVHNKVRHKQSLFSQPKYTVSSMVLKKLERRALIARRTKTGQYSYRNNNKRKKSFYDNNKHKACFHCTKKFENSSLWRNHIISEHPNESQKCSLCKHKFFSVSEYKKHLISCKKSQKFKGKFGYPAYNSKTNEKNKLHFHSMHEPESSNTQEKCNEISSSKNSKLVKKKLKNHSSCQYANKVKYSCPYCSKSYFKHHLKFHIYTHTGEKPYKCNICSKAFSQNSTLLMHVKRHLGVKPLKCDQCNFKTLRNTVLARHRETHLDYRPRPFLCDICGSAQLNQGALVQHLKGHGNYEFKCSYSGCHFKFNTHNKLKYHLRSHNNERPYLCDICGYAGKTFHQLKKHQRTHTGEKPFKCKHCSYSAAASSQLLRHMRLHSGSKPYKCPYCNYSCNTQENIRKHILKTKKHIGKKMYPCRFCEFSCNKFQEYKNHLLKTHSEHFPRGEKDIESSGIAGLYTKDFPRQVETPIPYTPRSERSIVKNISILKKRKSNKDSDPVNIQVDPLTCIGINGFDLNTDLNNSISPRDITPTNNRSDSVTNYPQESIYSEADHFSSGALTESCMPLNDSSVGTHILLTSDLECTTSGMNLGECVAEHQLSNTESANGSSNAILIYIPVN